jgi:hypothetical protein
MKTNNNKTITNSAYLLFFALLLASQSGYAQTEVSGGQTGTGHDRYIINSDESDHDAALRLQSKQGSTFNDWMLYNENGDGHLYISNWRSNSHSNSNENDIGEKYFIFRNGSASGDATAGELGINVVPNNGLDINHGNARTGTHAINRPMYITGPIGASSNGIEFRHYNATQGIGFGFNTIYATGTTSNQELNFQSRGTGNISLKTGGSSDLFINGSSGNVGIGTTNPLHKLQVEGDMKVNGILDVDGFSSPDINLDNLDNALFGTGAGSSNTSGTNSLFIGTNAGRDNTTGFENMFLGSSAGLTNTTGRQNVALGYNALNTNQTGWRNMAIGSYALGDNVNKTGNTAVGYDAGRHATNADKVVYIGYDAGRKDKYGLYNTLIGTDVAERLGETATSSNDTQYNAIIGGRTASSIQKGKHNTIIGSHAYGTATSGDANILIGYNVANNQQAISNELWIDNSNTANPLIWGDFTSNELQVNGQLNVGVGSASITGTVAHFDGRVYISENGGSEEGFGTLSGTNYDDYLLWVEEGIVSADFAIVETTDWPDYVFKESYKLSSIEEIEQHILEEGHLPNFPSAEEVETMGYSLDDMTKRLLKTVEEMTLHTIQQEKKIATQNSMMQQLLNRLEALENK